MNGAVEKWITGETPVPTPIAGLLLSTCGVSCPLEDEMLIWPQGGPTSTLTLSDLPRPSVDVRWRPLELVAVVTHLVTHPPRGAVAVMVGHGLRPPAKDRPGDA